MRYNKWEQRQLDQETGARLDERQRAWQQLVSEVAEIMEMVDTGTLDQWEREQYNRLKLEQENSHDTDR